MGYVFVRPASFIGDQLNDYRLRGILTDITIQVGAQPFPAHRSILQNVSPFLEGLLAGHFPQQNPNVFRIDEQFVEPGLMEPLLTYFYTGRITLTPDNAHALCIAAHFFQTDELVSACEKYLSGKVSHDNAVDFAVLADRLQLSKLLDRSTEQLSRNIHLLYDTKLMRLTKEGVEQIMTKLEELPNSGTAANDFRARWMNHDLVNRNEPGISAPSRSIRIQSNVTSSDRLFCIDGRNQPQEISTVSRFDSDTELWRSVTPMPLGNRYFAGAAYGTSIHLFGCSFKGGRYVKSCVFVYNCQNDTWRTGPKMPFRPNQFTTAAHLKDGVFVINRVSDDRTKQSSYFYNTVSKNWDSTMRRMHVRRAGHRLVALDGIVYAIGGSNAGTTAERCASHPNQDDDDDDDWDMIASTNYHHEDHSVTAHDGKIYVYSQAGFEAYDPNGDTWQKLSKVNTTQDYHSTLASANGRLLLIGGASQTNQSCSAVYSYDAYADQWSSAPDMDVPRAGHHSFVVNF